MKILFCTNQVNTHGGIERILCQKINSFIHDYGHQVILITFEQNNKPSVYELDKRLLTEDLSIKYQSGVSYFHPKNLFQSIKHFFRLKQVIKKHQPDIVFSISFTPEQYFLPFISRKIPKIKELHASGVVVSKQAVIGNGFSAYLKKKLIDIFGKYDKLVLLNKDEVAYFKEYNTIVIPNFTDFSISENFEKENTIIAAGRIADVKNFKDLVLIWSKIHKDLPDWKVKIFGDGEKFAVKNLQDQINELNMSESFLLLPSTKNIQKEFQKAQIFAMTSINECFPMVLLEAQVCGLPIISYDCPNGPRNIISHEVNGLLIEMSNVNLFSEELFGLINNPNLRIDFGENAKQNVLKFDKVKIMDNWNDFLITFKIILFIVVYL